MSDLGLDHTANGECINVISDKDILIYAANNSDATIDKNDTQTVHQDRKITVDGKHDETIKGDTTIKITEGKLDHDVVAGTAKYHVQGAVIEIFSDKQTTTVNKDIVITSETTKVHITAATEIQVKVGGSSGLFKADGNIVIDGSASIKIQSGASVMELKSDGSIKISGKKIEITGSEEVKVGVGNQQVTCNTSKVNVSGAAINSSAVGMHDIGGALIKIG